MSDQVQVFSILYLHSAINMIYAHEFTSQNILHYRQRAVDTKSMAVQCLSIWQNAADHTTDPINPHSRLLSFGGQGFGICGLKYPILGQENHQISASNIQNFGQPFGAASRGLLLDDS